MPATAHKPGRAAGTQTSPVLHVGRRVLTTPSRTIAIANISTMSVGTHVEHHPRALLAITAVIIAAMAFGATQVGLVAVGQWNPVSVALGVVSVGLAAYALKPQDKAHYLLISSADGAMTQFKGRDRAMLDDVRRLIADKIDKGDETAVFDVNFETGDIGKEAGPMPRGETQSEAGTAPNSRTAGRLRNAIMTHARTAQSTAAASRVEASRRKRKGCRRTEGPRAVRRLCRLQYAASRGRRDASLLCPPAECRARRTTLVGTRTADARWRANTSPEGPRSNFDARSRPNLEGL